jgi:hypothetical protein
MREGIVERADLESLIHHAVERGELRLKYQPIVELAGGVIVGVEALVLAGPALRRDETLVALPDPAATPRRCAQRNRDLRAG